MSEIYISRLIFNKWNNREKGGARTKINIGVSKNIYVHYTIPSHVSQFLRDNAKYHDIVVVYQKHLVFADELSPCPKDGSPTHQHNLDIVRWRNTLNAFTLFFAKTSETRQAEIILILSIKTNDSLFHNHNALNSSKEAALLLHFFFIRSR